MSARFSSVVVMVTAAAMVTMIVIGGTSSEEVNETRKEGVIGYSELETEFEMSSEIYRRILAINLASSVSGSSTNQNQQAVNCGRNNRYASCIARLSGGSGNCGNTFNRNCQ